MDKELWWIDVNNNVSLYVLVSTDMVFTCLSKILSLGFGNKASFKCDNNTLLCELQS
jgi:hypothetical protein